MTIRYFTGTIFSLILTLLSFGAVWVHVQSHHQAISHELLGGIILTLAIVQLMVQLVYFLHIGRESKSRDILALVFAAVIVVFVVGGSLWIMSNLMQNHGDPYDGTPTPQTEED